jgi:hypothetical protein
MWILIHITEGLFIHQAQQALQSGGDDEELQLTEPGGEDHPPPGRLPTVIQSGIIISTGDIFIVPLNQYRYHFSLTNSTVLFIIILKRVRT